MPERAEAARTDAASVKGTRLLLVALLVTLLLWNLPYDVGSYVLYPFKLFATWLHESSHGATMIVLGAGLDEMRIFRDTSGLAVPHHGVTSGAQAVISSAGYMGTALVGALLLVLGRKPSRARAALGVLGGIMTLSAIVWVANGFGAWAVGAFGGVCVGFALVAGRTASAFALNLLAAQACINAVLDIRVLFSANVYVNGQPHAQSDAHTVARIVGGESWMWALLWMIWSFALFYLALRRVRLRAAPIAAAAPAVTPPT